MERCDPGFGSSGGNFVNVPDVRSWKWSAYTLVSLACETAISCDHVHTQIH